MRDLTFRQASADDAAIISALAISVWVETYADQGIEHDFGRYIADHLSEVAYANLLAKSEQCALLSFNRSNLIGFAWVAHGRGVDDYDGQASELEKLYIHRNFKGRGVGKALFDMAFDEVLKSGGSALWLSVYHGNAAAISFYQKLGLTQISDVYFDLNGQLHLNHRYIRVKA